MVRSEGAEDPWNFNAFQLSPRCEVLYRGQRCISIPDFMIGYQRPFENAACTACGSAIFQESYARPYVVCLMLLLNYCGLLSLRRQIGPPC